MNYNPSVINSSGNNNSSWYKTFKKVLARLHLDFMLLLGILALETIGLVILYSASNQNMTLFWHQIASFGLAFIVMCVFAQIPVSRYQALIPWIFGLTLVMLLAVMATGVVSKGAQRWLNLGWFRFQPSEIMKLIVPMMLSWYLRNKTFPLNLKNLFFSCVLIVVPVLIIAKQPDLGTALLVAATGFFVLLLAGVTLRIILWGSALLLMITPIVWRFMRSYQKMRLFSFWSPESDPLGSGYNIIQSKIAIGSGGWLGKGWLHGSQAHLQFLPERSTDFIFAVYSEEFGFMGCMLLLTIFGYIIGRGLCISANAQDTFSRLLAGSLILTFFTSFFVNIGMVAGILPVVGVPLPLVSYGGSSLMTFMAGFGIIMSAQTHRKLIGS